jgi:hypothetical protein
MTALMRTADRVARTAPGGGNDASSKGRSWSFSGEVEPFPRQRQGDAVPTPRVIGGLDGQTVARH